MASAWITRRTTRNGQTRYRVEFRLGGRESVTTYGGSFRTRREADERKRWIGGEIAGLRVPDLTLTHEQPQAPTFAAAAELWRSSRVDVAEGTKVQQRTSIGRAVQALGDRRIDAIGAQDVAAMVAQMHEEGLKTATSARSSRRRRWSSTTPATRASETRRATS